MMSMCVHVKCQCVHACPTQWFGVASHEVFPACVSSLHSKALSPQQRLDFVPGMHEESLCSSRGHIQAQRGGKVNNRVALSTSIRIHQTSTPRIVAPPKVPHAFFIIIARRDLPTSPSPNKAPFPPDIPKQSHSKWRPPLRRSLLVCSHPVTNGTAANSYLLHPTDYTLANPDT